MTTSTRTCSTRRRRAGLVPLALALAFATPCALAQAPAPDACKSAEHRAFDFWIGEWDVADASGKPAGRNRIEAVHGGCVLHEQWQGRGGFTGSSLNVYDRQRKRWHQTWVDSSGGLLQLEGGHADGAMTLEGATTEAGPPPKKTLHRIRWQRQPDGRVRQLWEASEDDGKQWKVVFDGWYSKAAR